MAYLVQAIQVQAHTGTINPRPGVARLCGMNKSTLSQQ